MSKPALTIIPPTDELREIVERHVATYPHWWLTKEGAFNFLKRHGSKWDSLDPMSMVYSLVRDEGVVSLLLLRAPDQVRAASKVGGSHWTTQFRVYSIGAFGGFGAYGHLHSTPNATPMTTWSQACIDLEQSLRERKQQLANLKKLAYS